jgi:predicted DCC family thiol-disulfide oxidoreductase YuxK
VIVLYDSDCGFCRWAMAWVVRLDRRDELVAVPIQSPLGSELLVDLDPDDRLAVAHTVEDDGRRGSGGAAAAEVLAVIDPTRMLARLARASPRRTNRLYDSVATRRTSLGRFVGRGARQRADRLLEASRVTTAADLKVRSQRSPM